MNDQENKMKIHIDTVTIWLIAGVMVLISVAAVISLVSGRSEGPLLEVVFLIISFLFLVAAAITTIRRRKKERTQELERKKPRF